MTVAVLNPQDCLIKDYRISKQPLISPMKDSRNSNPNFSNRSNRTQPSRTKRSPPRPNRNPPPSRAATAKVPAKNNLVMGQVKILKRGEELTPTTPPPPPPPPPTKQAVVPAKKKKKSVTAVVQKRADPDLCSTDRLGPEPDSVPIQIRLTDSKNGVASFYAGSAFITSPPPSSLPLPVFFTKKTVTVKNDDATSDLRRILKLDML